MTGIPAEPAAPRAPIPCPRCGAEVAGDQAWCLECGLAARTRLAPAPNWRLPLVVAGAIGLASVVALVVAFVTITGDNAPLPTTAAPAPAATAPPAVDPAATTTVATVPTTPDATTVPVVPTTPDATPTVPAIPTETAPAVTTPAP